jgi:heme/copper-type cytochrome/quinol oxidase subunit 2
MLKISLNESLNKMYELGRVLIKNSFGSFEHVPNFVGAADYGQVGFQGPASPIMDGIIDLHSYICFYLFFIIGFVGWLLLWIFVAHREYAFTWHWRRIVKHLFIKFLDKLPAQNVLKTNLNDSNGIAWSAYLNESIRNNPYVSLKNETINTQYKKLLFGWELKNFHHWSTLEVVWTIIPSIILLFIAIPSFLLLYSMDEYVDQSMLVVKVIGHQWYWTYEINCFGFDTATGVDIDNLKSHEITSYMVPTDMLSFGDRRLLETDNPLVLPSNVYIRLIITSTDVLHSWAVPALGIKMDACPGRLNQTFMYIWYPGTYYGQCSEICGVNHGFMPIHIEAFDFPTWSLWYNKISVTG